MKNVRVGVIGCGVIAPSHIESYLGAADTEVAVLCDIVEEKAKMLASKYGIAKYTRSAQEVFSDPEIDAVSICTDHASHAGLAAAAIEAGKSVLCEKCLAASLPQLYKMLSVSAAHPGVAASGVFQHRFDPLLREVHDIVAEGLLGRLLTAEARLVCKRTDDYYKADAWRGTWAGEGGSVLINQAIHFIDQIIWTAGGVAAGGRACGVAANFGHHGVIETDDTAAAYIPLAGGAIGVVQATAASFEHWMYTLSYSGTEGFIEIRDDKPLEVRFADSARREEVARRLDGALEKPSEGGVGKAYYGGGHPAQIADFVDAVRTGRRPYVTFADAAVTARAVLEIYEPYLDGARAVLT